MFDYKNPNYTEVFAQRQKRLKKLREDKDLLDSCKIHYRTHPWDFINDWGMTFDPRNIEKNIIASMPFVLWSKQTEFLKWLHSRWQNQRRGLVEKSRDCGVTWLCAGYAVCMWLFVDGYSVGFGSYKEDKVDKKDDPDSIFEKIRFFLDNVPPDFMPKGYNKRLHNSHMKIANPDNGATITGEAGDEIGRGGRKSISFVDEAAFVENQNKVDSSLSQTTNCQIDISTPNGSGNLFYKKRMRFNNTDTIFIFDWRDDPRKDQVWYQIQVEENDEVTVAQEIDRDYEASAEDVFIPSKWVKSCIDAHIKLGFHPEGIRSTGFDPADIGDAKAIVNRYGSVITQAKQLTKGDITQAIPWAFDEADLHRADVLSFDGDGMGAPVMKVSLTNMAVGRMKIHAYHGSSAVSEPDNLYGASTGMNKESLKGLKTNKDRFLNYRSQSWTWFRDRCKATYDAMECARKGQIVKADPEDLISISSECVNLTELVSELSRPKRIFTKNFKIKVEGKEDMKARRVDSPNLADAAVMAFSIKKPKEESLLKLNYRAPQVHDKGVAY